MTKFTFNSHPGSPNSSGNGRKNIYRALTGSLERLKTDYIDLYWMHYYGDQTTPVEGFWKHRAGIEIRVFAEMETISVYKKVKTVSSCTISLRN